MKKLLAFALLLCVLFSCARADLATDIVIAAAGYNAAAKHTGAPTVTANAYTTNGNYCTWTDASGNVFGFITEGDHIQFGVCVCYHERNIGAFLSECAALSLAMTNTSNVTDLYSSILQLYFNAKAGKEAQPAILPNNVIISIERTGTEQYIAIIDA